MSVPIFPPEILDLFLNELGSAAIKDPQSRAALLVCTQVNRQFYHQANSHIFSSILIGYPANDLHDLLGILNPEIARHIRSFTLEMNRDNVHICIQSLPAVLKQLCNLQKFKWTTDRYSDHLWYPYNIDIASTLKAL